MQQKVASIDMPKYNPKESLRLYIKSFLNIAQENGLSNKNMMLIPTLAKHMPDNIRLWMVNLAPTSRQSWDATVFELLSYFSVSEDEENRKALQELRQASQKLKQTIRVHTTNWYLKYRIVIMQGAAMLPDADAKTMFIQFFKEVGIRSTLTAVIVSNFQMNMHSLVELALRIGENVTPVEFISQVQQEFVEQDDPMELDYMNGKFNKGNHKGKFYKKQHKKF